MTGCRTVSFSRRTSLPGVSFLFFVFFFLISLLVLNPTRLYRMQLVLFCVRDIGAEGGHFEM